MRFYLGAEFNSFGDQMNRYNDDGAHPLQKMMPLPIHESAQAGTAVLLTERRGSGDIDTFLAQRSFGADGFAGYLCCPGGKPHDGEDPFVAAQREVQEETGLGIALDRFSWVGVIVIWKGGSPIPVWLFLVELREGEIPKTPEGEESTLLGPWERYDLRDDLAVTEALTPGTVALVEIAKTRYRDCFSVRHHVNDLDKLSALLSKARNDSAAAEAQEDEEERRFYEDLPRKIVTRNLQHIEDCAKRGGTACRMVTHEGDDYWSIRWEAQVRIAVDELTALGLKVGFRVEPDEDYPSSWRRIRFCWD